MNRPRDPDQPAAIRRAVERLLNAGVIGSFDYRAVTQSTNDDAKQFARSEQNIASDILPRLFIVDSQTAGRGRHGRSWISAAGGLTFSVLINAGQVGGCGNVSIATAVAMVESLQRWLPPIRISLKWPNDVFIDDAKAAGILIESVLHRSQQFLIIGIGMNVGGVPTRGLQGAATALFAADQPNVPTAECSAEVLESVVGSLLNRLCGPASDYAEVAQIYQRRCRTIGCQVQWIDARRCHCHGEAIGIDDTGGLVVLVAGKQLVLRSGEVQEVRTNRGLGLHRQAGAGPP